MKIKYLDTGEVVEVTRAQQLANTRFVAQNEFEVADIHEMGFYPFDEEARPGDAIFLWDTRGGRDLEYTIAPNNEPLHPEDECGEWREFQFLSVSSITEERPAEGWISVEDRPFVKNSEWTAESREEFLAAVPTNKGWWIRHCLIEPETGCLYVCCDDHIESAGWEYTDITHYLPITEPYKLTP